MTDYRDLLPVIVEREGAALPDGFDSWGLKSVHPDLRTTRGYRWPAPGDIAECDPGRIIDINTDACPAQVGDGLCVATSWRGMASGSIPARTLLLVAYTCSDVLGRDEVEGKLRCPRVAVVALVDGERLLRETGTRANLTDANLRYANLTDADLRYANLTDADLTGANLTGANLRHANLTGANLTDANLRHANLTDANLRHANLTDANLRYANLRYDNLTRGDLTRANLRGADLRGADLTDADLRYANLRYANLRGANLTGANLTGAEWTALTSWPAGFSPEEVA